MLFVCVCMFTSASVSMCVYVCEATMSLSLVCVYKATTSLTIFLLPLNLWLIICFLRLAEIAAGVEMTLTNPLLTHRISHGRGNSTSYIWDMQDQRSTNRVGDHYVHSGTTFKMAARRTQVTCKLCAGHALLKVKIWCEYPLSRARTISSHSSFGSFLYFWKVGGMLKKATL